MTTDRPPSSLTILADRLQRSTLDDCDDDEDVVAPGVWVRTSVRRPSVHRHSADIYNFYASGTAGSTAFVESSDLQMWEPVESDNFNNETQELVAPASSCSPPKRQCRSHSAGAWDCLPRPIALRPTSQVRVGKVLATSRTVNGPGHVWRHQHHSTACPLHPHQQHQMGQHYHYHKRSIASPHMRCQSAFTPTGPLMSPLAASSDYSLSPDTDPDSVPRTTPTDTAAISTASGTAHHHHHPQAVAFRPASVSSSGFHDLPLTVSMAEALSLPDCSAVIDGGGGGGSAMSATPITPSPPAEAGIAIGAGGRGNSSSSFYSKRDRCQSQPCFDLPCCCQTRPLVGFKRRIGGQSTGLCDCSGGSSKPGSSFSNPPVVLGSSAPSAGADCMLSNNPHEVFFFGSNRSYLVSLPRIASSPRRTVHHQQPSSAQSSSTTDSGNTLTAVSSSSSMQRTASYTTSFSAEESQDMDDSSWGGVSSPRDPLDPPRIMEEAHPRVLAAAASAGFCFRPLTKALPPFQELDLDLIEND